ncbi:BBP7 family outer membrane beta-barrel protein [Allorhodopirellula solitaria]|uniref:Uncharacterized protein n=1 Tax=Allorhodopirellula solitaria TaxID=2527987 RepID=A0A5C5YKJ3_9BACT|nr:BBP7 family outer membrane beta-barrel protein [Allorhodopirellula solitaria]TWT75433.1 hypothetical protein CA85_07240 [Allorhodopirellula solitaria]
MSQRLNNTRRILLAVAAATATACLSTPAFAQSGSPPVNGIEQSARAAWQPVRDLSRGAAEPSDASGQIRLVDHQAAASSTHQPAQRSQSQTAQPQAGQLRPVSHAHAASSVLSEPILMDDSVPMDGQVMLEPMQQYHGGPVSMGGSYGCDDMGCDGACGASMGGCDGMGCTSGSCSNGDPMCGEYRDCDSVRPCLTLCWPQDGWFSAEYLMWWQDGMSLPPLASTGRLSSRDPLANGSILYGGNDVITDNLNGGRIDFGFWFDECHTWGIGAGGFGLDRSTSSFAGGSQNDPLVRPIITVLPSSDPNMDELSEAVALVNYSQVDHTGTLNIDVDSQLSGWNIYLRHFRIAEQGCTHAGPCSCPTRWCSRSEHRLGFRSVELDEGIAIDSNVMVAGAGPGDGPLTFALQESFRTRNQFNGIDFGWHHSRSIGYWNFDLGIQLGVGNIKQSVQIAGSTVINGTSPALNGGLLALNSNIGNYERNEFAVLPEFNAKMGYQLTDHLRATFGYTFLYMSNVVRPGDQIERIIDQSQVPNANAPTPTGMFPRFAFDNTDYWAQGLNFGLNYRW